MVPFMTLGREINLRAGHLHRTTLAGHLGLENWQVKFADGCGWEKFAGNL